MTPETQHNTTPALGDRIIWKQDGDILKGLLSEEKGTRFEIRRGGEEGSLLLTHLGEIITNSYSAFALKRYAEAILVLRPPLPA